MNKLLITVALTGAETTKADQPALPVSPKEIGISAAQCVEAGAAMVHLHGRLDDGRPTQEAAVYAEIIREVRSRCDAIIQVSTGGAVGMTPKERLAPLTLQGKDKPEMATLSMGSVNFGGDVFLNTPDDMAVFAKTIIQAGVKPELEIFEAGMLHTAIRWMSKGLLPHSADNPAHIDFVLGVPGAMMASAESLLYLKAQLLQSSAKDATWCVAGIGSNQLPMAALSITLGGHVRVGFEDNIYFRKGELAKSNAQLVERVAAIAKLQDRMPMTPNEGRIFLHLPLA